MAQYIAGFSGAELDSAVGHSLANKKMNQNIVVDSSPTTVIDLDLYRVTGTYFVKYFSNSYNDEASGVVISLKVNPVSDTAIEQSYELAGGQLVHRYYVLAASTWTDWEAVSDVKIVNSSDTVRVSKPTLVVRKATSTTDNTINTEADIPYME